MHSIDPSKCVFVHNDLYAKLVVTQLLLVSHFLVTNSSTKDKKWVIRNHCYFELFTIRVQTFNLEGELVTQPYPSTVNSLLTDCKIWCWSMKIVTVPCTDCTNLTQSQTFRRSQLQIILPATYLQGLREFPHWMLLQIQWR